MTRKEETYKAARDYINGVIFSSPSDVIHFENGAKWADEHPNLESLWHDVSEEPIEYPILCIDEFSNTWLEYSLNDYVDGWVECVEFHELIRWAYVDDLLPKQFGNPEQLKGGNE